MPKLFFSKKNNVPQTKELHPDPISAEKVWAYILGIGFTFALGVAIVSGLISFMIMSDDPFTSNPNEKVKNPVTLINTDKLNEAVQIIYSRTME